MKARNEHGFGGAGESNQEPASIIIRLIDHLQKVWDVGRTRTVLEYGCGLGRNVEPFLQSKLDFNVVAFDLKPNIPKLQHRFAEKKIKWKSGAWKNSQSRKYAS